VSRTARVITASTRAAAGTWSDTSGPIVVEGLRALGIEADDAVVVADGEPLHVALVRAVSDGVDLVVTTGGTGHTPMDLTPEMTLRVVERLSPGLAEAVRAHGVANGVPTAILSRGIAGIAGTTLIVNLPGSAGGARDGMAALSPVLLHAIDQVHGGDHARTDAE
jgi:molybdenum cofactor synthesis domain-containing protein